MTLAWLAGLAMVAISSQAGIVYDNSTTTLGSFYGSTNEFGDQIKLAGNPLERTITQFRFDYYLSHGVNGDEKLTFKLYDNTGPNGSPGNELYETSTPIQMNPGYNTVTIDGLNLNVPDNITFTVQLTGIEGNETGGLLLYDPPTVGSSFNDLWEKDNGTWTLKTFAAQGGPIANFGAQVIAVPEPSTVQYLLLGGLTLVGSITYRRRSAK